MSHIIADPAPPAGDELPLVRDDYPTLWRELIWLMSPVLAEHVLHIFVGVNDTYLANHIPEHSAEAAAAVGTVSFIFWFLGMFSGAIGTGATAIIAREIGARHRRRANGACGQAMLFAALLGAGAGVLLYFIADPIADFSGLTGKAHEYTLRYLRLIGPSAPFLVLMFV